MNSLYYGDNLDVLRKNVAPESVDLVYLDPPFNSSRAYNVLFRSPAGVESAAQIQAFDDTWRWSQQTDAALDRLVGGGEAPAQLADALTAMRHLLGTSDMMAYLVMMAPRLLELHRVLKSTGSVYLHCDPTASHYLKMLLDAIFEPANFRNEIIWKRTSAHSSAKRYGPVHDVLLFYSKSETYVWNPLYQPYDPEYLETFYEQKDSDGRRWKRGDLTGDGVRGGESGLVWRGVDVTKKGRHWAIPREASEKLGLQGKSLPERLEALDAAGLIHWPKKTGGVPRYKQYADQQPGVPQQDVWTDISPLHNLSEERLGYPTQKPVALLERIIRSSSNNGDLVLDPFCGCGTAIDAAQRLGRQWIGIDVTYLAIDLIRKRLLHSYGQEIERTYTTRGIPTDLEGAKALFRENHFEFERWAVSQVNGQPKDKPGGDLGIDGRIRFHADQKRIGQVIVSVKGGEQLNPAMVRDLVGTVGRERAEMGILLSLEKPTPGMTGEAAQSGTYTSPLTGQSYPKIQVFTVNDYFEGRTPKMPPAILPYFKAKEWGGQQSELQLVAERGEPYRTQDGPD